MAGILEHNEKIIGDAAWRRFVMTFVLVFGGGLTLLCILIIAIDPYDSGRFPTFMPAGVSDENQQTANASDGRNPRFNAAVFGNSHGMLLSPARLANLTSLPFVEKLVEHKADVNAKDSHGCMGGRRCTVWLSLGTRKWYSCYGSTRRTSAKRITMDARRWT